MIREKPQDFFSLLKVEQLGDLLCCFLPICKQRRSVLVFGTQQRKMLADRHGVLKIEVAHSVIDKNGEKVSQAKHYNLSEYLGMNALKQCKKIFKTMQQRNMSFS